MVEPCEELHNKGNSLFSEGKYKEAIDAYKKCLIKSTEDKNRRQIVHRNLAQCFLNLCKYDEAIQAANEGNLHYFLFIFNSP